MTRAPLTHIRRLATGGACVTCAAAMRDRFLFSGRAPPFATGDIKFSKQFHLSHLNIVEFPISPPELLDA